MSIKVKKSGSANLGKFWKKLGLGLVAGVSDNNPSGIATYSQTGAQYGFQLLWMALLTLPLMIVVQEMCARIGMVTGEGLAANIRKNYSRPILLILVIALFVANTFKIAANLSVMAAGIQLLFPSVNVLVVIFFIVIFSSAMQVLITYKTYAKYLKYLTLVLIAYPITVFFIHVEIKEVLQATFMPTINFYKNQILLICAILGTIISPYLFFWKTSQVVEEKVATGRKTIKERQGTTQKSLRWMNLDIILEMGVSNFIMFFIILISGATLFKHGITDIKDATQAASALKPFAGASAEILFALGMFGTGLLAIPVLAGSSAYAFAEIFYLKEGLYKKFKEAYAFYSVILLAMVIAFVLNIVKLDPIKALIYSAIANGVIAPIILFFIIKLASNSSVLGKKKNSILKNWLGWIVTGIMAASALAAITGILIF